MNRNFQARLTTVLVLLLLCCGSLAQGQSPALDLEAHRQLITPVAVDWRFHPGDDPRWAQPNFDDSSWKLMQPADDWDAQGYSEQQGLAWFRFRVLVPASMAPLVMQLPRIDRSYQLFANGELIGQTGSLPPQPGRTITSAARVFDVPTHPGDKPQQITFALRLWQAPRLAGITPSGLRGRAYAGEAATVLRQFSLGKSAALLSYGAQYTEAIIVLIVGAASFLLFWLHREGYYLWFATNMALTACSLPIHLLSQHFAWNYFLSLYAYILVDLLGNLTLALFLLGALKVRGWKVVLATNALCVLAEAGPVLLIQSRLPLIWADGTYFLATAALDILLLRYLVLGWRKGAVTAKLLLLPYCVGALSSGLDNLGHWLLDANVPHASSLLTTGVLLLREPFAVSLSDVGGTISLLGLLAVLVHRFAETSREEQRMASALQAAHDIQHRLVPVDIPSLGGLHTEILYLPAEEVGGDFCQVLPRPDGSILVTIGDVSGKGLQAAMLGTLAVGALRSMSEEDIEPAAALERLNQVTLRTENAGFITCLCLKLSPDGFVTLANAGHLSPYLNGVEIALQSGLPLGLVPEIEYEQVTLLLPETARLTLLSDGVVEARSRTGELFGFDRTSAISQLPASQIAAAAHKHGQEDDITIITLDWKAPVEALLSA